MCELAKVVKVNSDLHTCQTAVLTMKHELFTSDFSDIAPLSHGVPQNLIQALYSFYTIRCG